MNLIVSFCSMHWQERVVTFSKLLNLHQQQYWHQYSAIARSIGNKIQLVELKSWNSSNTQCIKLQWIVTEACDHSFLLCGKLHSLSFNYTLYVSTTLSKFQLHSLSFNYTLYVSTTLSTFQLHSLRFNYTLYVSTTLSKFQLHSLRFNYTLYVSTTLSKFQLHSLSFNYTL